MCIAKATNMSQFSSDFNLPEGNFETVDKGGNLEDKSEFRPKMPAEQQADPFQWCEIATDYLSNSTLPHSSSYANFCDLLS